ncbi:YppG family protein [Bacillus sp. AGMB 02131]|uniref:YppG family protein n=1 Tax=Peribacillus faecalis TaxID=2772559 RepID=A0A927HC42_9BACI|nr:YppG family protein [Peribacillus faecalis]MBD3110435.1 YppG family protein [Peribacillus faecalis]
MVRYESYNQPIYPMMGNFQNAYGPPGYQQAPPAYPQQAPFMATGGFYPYSAMSQNQYAPEQGMPLGQNYYNQTAPPRPNPTLSPFANPLQMKKNQQQSPQMPYPNPYPKQSFMQKPQTSGFQSVLKQFKTQDGSFDINKMMNTAGQMMGTVSQVQSMFKGLGGLFKTTP